ARHAVDELRDRLRLVAGRLVIRDELERLVGHRVGPLGELAGSSILLSIGPRRRAPYPPSSSRPRRYSHSATIQQKSAQTAPAAHPASTSVGQCTPRYTRLKPTQTVRKSASPSRNALSPRRDCERDRKSTRLNSSHVKI